MINIKHLLSFSLGMNVQPCLCAANNDFSITDLKVIPHQAIYQKKETH